MPVTREAIEAAMVALSSRDLTTEDPAEFVDGYLPLVRLFEALGISRADVIDPELVKAGAYAVYGWMPTMLRRPPNAEQASLLSKFLAATASGAKLALAEHLDVLQAVNCSVVGTSKFLHFARPSTFPIWDSIVAKTFGLRHRYQFSSPEVYCSYYSAVHGWLDSGGRLPPNFTAWLTSAASGPDPSVVRQIELALYLQGKLLRKEAGAHGHAP